MVDNGSDGKDSSQNADDVNEKRMPLVVGLDLQYSHWVGLIPVLGWEYLK